MVKTRLLAIDDVNAMDQEAFVATFGEVLEASPHLAAAAWTHRPYADRDALAAAFAAAVDALDRSESLTLLNAHPTLGARGPMAAASVGEQAGAGIEALGAQRRERLAADNAEYAERFGFPFILAVSGLTTDDIDAAMARRLDHSADVELGTALAEVKKIAAIRLGKLVDP